MATHSEAFRDHILLSSAYPELIAHLERLALEQMRLVEARVSEGNAHAAAIMLGQKKGIQLVVQYLESLRRDGTSGT